MVAADPDDGRAGDGDSLLSRAWMCSGPSSKMTKCFPLAPILVTKYSAPVEPIH
jgi:hypothetical protein